MGKASRKKEQQIKGILSTPIPASPHQNILVRPLPALPIVFLLSFIVNFNVLNNGFGWDDETIIQNLHPPEHGWQIGSVLFPQSTVKQNAPYFRPLVELSYSLDYAPWGNQPFGFHLSVLLAHLLNTALVFLLAQALVRDQKPPYTFLPILVASFFAVHPVHAEAIAWIAGRNDVFCTMFILSSMLLYTRFRQTGKNWAFILSMLFFFFALLTKEIAVGLVLLFPLYDYLSKPPNSSQTRKLFGIRFMIPFMILGLYFWMRAGHITSPLNSSVSGNISSPLLSVMAATGLYLKLMLFPFPHIPFIAALPNSSSALILSGMGLILLLGGMVWAIIRRHRLIGWGLAWTVVLLAPALPLAFLIVAATPAAERYAYGPSAGFMIVVAGLILKGLDGLQTLRRWPPRPIRLAAGLAWVALIGLWGWQSWDRNTAWRSPATFWKAAIAAAPEAGIPYRNLGMYYAHLDRHAEAEPLFRRSLSIREKVLGPEHPDVAHSLANLALLYYAQGRYAEAEPLYRRSLEIREKTLRSDHPDRITSLRNYAVLLRKMKRDAEAIQWEARVRLLRSKPVP